MATQKSWGNRREKGMPASLSTGWRGAAPTPQTCRPRPASARVEGTRAHCSEAGSSPEGRGRRVKSSQPSLPLLGRLGAEAQKPRPPPLHGQPPVGPFPLLLFRLPNYQAEVAVWFALFLHVK